MKVGPYVLDELQSKAVENVRDSMRAGNDRVIMQAPTGTGKTVMALAIMSLAAERGNRVGVITSGRQLIYQMARKCEEAGLDYSVLLANSGYSWSPDAQSLIISKDTLVARWGRVSWRQPDLYIVDECDVCVSDQWRKIIERSPRTVGLTATPITGAGDGLGFLYDDMVEVAAYSDLIKSGRLVDIPEGNVYSPYRPDLVGGKSSAGEWNQHWLGERMNKQHLVGDIVSHWSRLARGRKTVVFCTTKAHTVAVCEAFNAAKIKAEFIIDETTQFERDQIFERTTSGETQVIVNCATLTRGWDLPCISCAVLAKPTKRLRLYLQMVGRILRASPGKKDALLIDHSGCVWEHGWPTEDRTWGLDGECPKSTSQPAGGERAEPPERKCPQCDLVLPGYRSECGSCGWKRLQRGDMVETEDGTLRSLTRKKRTQQETRQRKWTSLLFAFGRSGKTYAQAASVFRRDSGVWPDAASVYPLAPEGRRRELISSVFGWTKR